MSTIAGDEQVHPAQALLHQWADSFTRHDLAAAQQVFSARQDLLVVTAGAVVLRGPASVRRYLEQYVAGPVTYAWQWATVVVAAAPGEPVAWLAAEGVETRSSPGAVVQRPYRATLVSRRDETGGWRIWHFHGSSPR